MVTRDSKRAARLKISRAATGTNTTYSRASPLDIQQFVLDPVEIESIE